MTRAQRRMIVVRRWYRRLVGPTRQVSDEEVCRRVLFILGRPFGEGDRRPQLSALAAKAIERRLNKVAA